MKKAPFVGLLLAALAAPTLGAVFGHAWFDMNISELPASCDPGRVFMVKDGNSASDCSTGSGSDIHGCVCDSGGASYTALSALAAPGGATTQVQFNNAGTLDGDDDLTWASNALTIGAVTAASHLILPNSNDEANPTIAFGDGDSGIFEYTDDGMKFSLGGTYVTFVSETALGMRGATDTGLSAALMNEDTTATNPVIIPRLADDDMGIGSAAVGQMSLISGGEEFARVSDPGDVASGEVFRLSGPDRATPAAADEAYMSFLLEDAGGMQEHARITAIIEDPTNLGEESELSFKVTQTGNFTEGLRISGAATGFVQTIFPAQNQENTPTIAFDDADSGIYESQTDTISISLDSTEQWYFQNGTGLYAQISGGPGIQYEDATATNPSLLPTGGDADTGIGSAALDQLSLIAGNVEGMRLTESTTVQVQMPSYGSGTFTGVDAKWLAVDSSGNIIEEDPPGGTGDVTDVGDCDGPACFAGAEGTTLTFETAGAADVALDAASTGSNVTMTLPAATDTLVGKATTDTFTNKTYDGGGTGNEFTLRGSADCDALTDGVADEPCYDTTTETIWVCEPTAGACDTAAEWQDTGTVGAGVKISDGTERTTLAATDMWEVEQSGNGTQWYNDLLAFRDAWAENGGGEVLGETLGTACSENQILKANATGGLDCAADAGGAANWEDLTNTANTATSFVGDNDLETFTVDFQSAFSTDRFSIKQTTGDPSAGTLLDVRAADAQVTVLKAGDGTNGIEVTQAGILQITGTGENRATEIDADADGTSEVYTTGAVVEFDPDDSGAWDFGMTQGVFYAADGGGIADEQPSATNPSVIPDVLVDIDTGMGSAGLDILSMVAGGVEGLRLTEATNVQMQLPSYGSGTFTGTDTKWLAVDASGNVIEEDPPAGGTPNWEDLANTADTATSYLSSADAETVTFDFQSNFSTDRFSVKQTTGTPTAGTLVDFRAANSNVTVLKAGDGTNGIQVTQAGVLGITGTGENRATEINYDNDANDEVGSSGTLISFDADDDGTGDFLVAATSLYASNASGPRLENAAPSSSNPTLNPTRGDADTGIGWNAADQLSMVAGADEAWRFEEQAYGTAAGDSVAWVSDIATVPSSNPTGGVVVYSDADSLLFRDTGGDVRDLKEADPVCKTLFDSGGLTDTDDISSLHRFRNSITVQEVWCETDTGTATITLEDGSGNDLTTSCSCDNSGDTGNTCTLTANDTFTDGELLDFLMVTAAGNRLTFCVEYDYN